MDYGATQVRELDETINRIPSNVELIATPVDLGRISTIKQSIWRVTYRLEEQGTLGYRDVIRAAF